MAEEVRAAFFEEDEPVEKALAAFEAGEKGVTGWPEGVPERVEVTATYRCDCPEVADITEEMLDEALKRARLKRLLGMYDCKIPEGEVGLRGEMFVVAWSTEDREWLATAAGKESLSWLAGTPVEALAGLVKVLEEEVLYDGA